MALTAFTSFSLLVAGSVALSNGTATAPWQPAMAHDAQGPQQAGPSGTDGDDAARPTTPSVFASVADQQAISAAQAVPASAAGGSTVPNSASIPNSVSVPGSVSAQGAAGGVSSLDPTGRAPATFEGKLPTHTLIAPAQPVIVLKGGEFGWRTAPDTGQHELHNGTDISVPEGTPVVAALDGTVTAVFWDVWGGNRVEVSHANGMKTTYNHLSKIMVRVGDSLKASEQLGEVGHTGLRVTGPHLHFETWVHAQVVDAQSFDWKTGKGMIPASRPAYSTQDGDSVQPAVDPNAKPGTDLGPLPKTSELPAGYGGRIDALKKQNPSGKGGTSGGSGSTGGSGATTASGAKGSGSKSTDAKAPGKVTASGGGTGAGTGTTAPDKGTGGTSPGTSKDTTKPGTGKPSSSGSQTPKPSTSPQPSTSPEPTASPKPTKTPVPTPTQTPEPTPTPTQTPAPTPTTTTPAAVNPYTADITQLSTLLQFQQRTQRLLSTQIPLAPAEKFGPATRLNTELTALTTRATALGLAATDPAFTAQLTTTQQAVAAASAKPTDPKLTAAASAELTKLQTLVATAPAYPEAPVAGK